MGSLQEAGAHRSSQSASVTRILFTMPGGSNWSIMQRDMDMGLCAA